MAPHGPPGAIGDHMATVAPGAASRPPAHISGGTVSSSSACSVFHISFLFIQPPFLFIQVSCRFS